MDERKAQRSYWEERTREFILDAIRLDSRVAELNKEELPEVIYPATIFFARVSLASVRVFVIRQLEPAEHVSRLCLPKYRGVNL